MYLYDVHTAIFCIYIYSVIYSLQWWIQGVFIGVGPLEGSMQIFFRLYTRIFRKVATSAIGISPCPEGSAAPPQSAPHSAMKNPGSATTFIHLVISDQMYVSTGTREKRMYQAFLHITSTPRLHVTRQTTRTDALQSKIIVKPAICGR